MKSILKSKIEKLSEEDKKKFDYRFKYYKYRKGLKEEEAYKKALSKLDKINNNIEKNSTNLTAEKYKNLRDIKKERFYENKELYDIRVKEKKILLFGLLAFLLLLAGIFFFITRFLV
jgi:hypothetical protein